MTTIARTRQHDAHVRARRAIVKRVLDRMVEWGSGDPKRASETWEAFWARRTRAVEAALAAHVWREGWGDKRSAYHPYPWMVGRKPQHVVGPYADVPVNEIHKIMCDTGEVLRRQREKRP